MQKLLIAIRPELLAEALTRALSAWFAVHCCSTGADACRLAEELRPDAMVLDLRLSDGGGLSVLDRCRYKPPVVLAVTDLMSGEVRRLAENAGIHALVPMPCSARHVAALIEQLIAKIPSAER